MKLFKEQSEKNISKNSTLKNKKSRKRGFLVVFVIFISLSLFFLGFYIGNKVYINIQINEAGEYVSNDQYQEAIDVYLRLLERDEENEEAKKGLKKSYVSLCEEFLENDLFFEVLETAKQGYEITKDSKLMNIIEMLESGEIENEDNQLSKKINYMDDGSILDYTKYVYYKNGKIKREEHYNHLREMQTFETYEYDYENRLINRFFFYANGNVLYFEEKYNKSGELEEIVDYNSEGVVIYRETYEKMRSNHITTKFFEDGSKAEEIYNTYGRITQITNWEIDGNYVISEYDSKERLKKTFYYDKNGETICFQDYNNDFHDGLLRYAYNDYGDLQYIYEFDLEDRLYYKYEYDEYEYLIKATEYDDLGRKVSILWFDYYEDIEQYLTIEYRENESVYRYYGFDFFYDEYLMYYDVYEYDNNGNELKMTSFYGDGTLAYYYINEYDDLGHLRQRFDFDGLGKSDGWIEYACDENGNPLVASYYGPNEEYYGVIDRIYDENGNILRIETFDEYDRRYAYAEYVYDKDGYVIRKIKED